MTGFGGLLSADPGQLYGNPNLQDPAVQQAIANRGLLAAVGSFGESAMPTRVPTPIGAVLGRAAGAMGTGEDAAIKARTDAMQGQLYGAQAAQAQQTVAALRGMVDPNSPYYKLTQAWFNQGQGGQNPLMPNQPPPSESGGGFGSNSAGTLAMLASPLGDKIKYYANYHGLDPNVFAGMINVESSGNPNALNKSSGAAGLGQLIPSNFAKYGVKNPYDIDQNLDASAHLLADNLKAANGDMNLALKYYFAGQDQSKWGPNTAAYPGLVMSRVPPAQTAAAQAQQQQAANAPSSLSARPGATPSGAPGGPSPAAPAAAAAPAAPGMLPGSNVPNMTAPGGLLGGLPPRGAPVAAAGGGELGSPLGPAQAQIIAGLLGRQQAGAPARFAGPGAAEPAPPASAPPAPPAAPAGAGGPGMLPGGVVPDVTAPGGLLSGQGAPAAAAAPPPPAVPPPAAPGPPGAAPGTPLSLLKPPPTPAIPAPPTLPGAVAPTGGAATGGMSPETMRAGQALQLIGALTGHPEFGQMVTSSPQFQAAVEAAKQGAIFPFQSALETQKGQQELVKTMYQGSIDLQKAGYEKQTEAVWGMIRDQMKPQDMRTGTVIWNPALQSYMANYEAVDPKDGTMHRYLGVIGPNSPTVQPLDLGQSKLSPGQEETQKLTAQQTPIAVGPPQAPGAAPGSTPTTQPTPTSRGTLLPPTTMAAPITGTNEELTERSKDFADTVNKWGESTSGNYQTINRLEAMANALKVYQSGPISEHLSDVRALLDNAGIRGFDSWFQDPAQAQIILKNNIQAALGSLDQSGLTRQTQGELFAIQKNLANPGLTPAANLAILSQGLGTLRWQQAMMNDWADAKKAGWRDPQDFERNWAQLNPLDSYVQKEQAQIGPLRGMPGNAGPTPTPTGGAPPLAGLPQGVPPGSVPSRVLPDGRQVWKLPSGQEIVPKAGR